MTALRLFPICAATLFCVAAAAGQDAAQKVQEGNVKQWMEYYERERGRADQRDVNEEAGTGSGQGPRLPDR